MGDDDVDCVHLQCRLKEYPYGDLSALLLRDYKHILSVHRSELDMDSMQFMTQRIGRLVQCDEEQCPSMKRMKSESMKEYVHSIQCMMDGNEDGISSEETSACTVSYELMDLMHCYFVHQWSSVGRGKDRSVMPS